MSWKHDKAPFYPGQWQVDDNPDANNLSGTDMEGCEFEFQDIDYSVRGARTVRSQHTVKRKLVRNVSGGALLGKRLAKFKAGYYGKRVDGYTITDAAHGYPIDEFLPAAGVPNYGLFYIVIEGPATVKVPASAGAFAADIAEGDMLVALTAASQANADAGHVYKQVLPGTYAASTVADQVNNALGRAMAAAASATTNADLLVMVGRL